ncbi:hypothetical protein tb265_28400 [Gemmatimonadetes bacterium T265]|nr:hypothetical protein tb265_28400 [Gemmatimonadetes bacterium T265]
MTPALASLPPRVARGADDPSTLVMSNLVIWRVARCLRALLPRRAARGGRVAALLALVVGAAACSEQLDSGATCTTLCPLANEQLRDTVFDPVALDTTLAGFPLAGATRALLVATAPAPDSADVRAVIRFDSIPAKYAPPAGGDSLAITAVDDTYVRLTLDTTLVPLVSGSATLEAYDVDTTAGVDTATATLATLFRPDRRLGTSALTFAAGKTFADSLHLHLSDSALAAKAQTGGRLRIGLRLVSTVGAQIRVLGVRSGTSLSTAAPTLSFDPATDTVYRAVTVNPASDTTGVGALVAAAAIDQSLVVVSPRGTAGTDLIVGGAPGRRSLIRFNLPIRLTDSTDVVRAALELTQRPVRYVAATDTVRLRSEAVLATTSVTDLVQAALLAAPAGLSVDTLSLSPADSGTRTFSLVTLIRSYRALPSNTMRAIALRVPLEGAQAGEVRFFSTEAPAAVRPRLRLTYIPRTSFGIP